MHEGPAGNRDTRTPLHLPSDTQQYAHSSSYQLYLSHSAKQLILSTIDYHPGQLHLPRQELQRISTLILQPLSETETRVDLQEELIVIPLFSRRLFQRTVSWEVNALPGKAIFEAKEYHAGALYVSHKDLEELIQRCAKSW